MSRSSTLAWGNSPGSIGARLLLLTGAETSSTSLGRILYSLALNQDVQQKLRDEVMTARDLPEREISYDDLTQLPYMDAVIRETMRLCVSSPHAAELFDLRKDVFPLGIRGS